jgi:hypothetical protein
MLNSSRVVSDTTPGVYELFQTAQSFLDTLHSILRDGAEHVETDDAEYAETVRGFEYNWLSLMGYNKGLLPLVSDFYFNYSTDENFMRENDKLITRLRRLISAFTAHASTGDIYKELVGIVAVSLDGGLFHDGVIKNFLLDLKEIVDDQDRCTVLLNEARKYQQEVVHLLNFLLVGESSKKAPTHNSEL